MKTDKYILVAGDKTDRILFELIGLKTFLLQKKEDLDSLVVHCEAEKNSIAGLMISAKYYNTEEKFYTKLEKLGFPIVMLPDPSGQKKQLELDKLQEKTLGMKISKK